MDTLRHRRCRGGPSSPRWGRYPPECWSQVDHFPSRARRIHRRSTASGCHTCWAFRRARQWSRRLSRLPAGLDRPKRFSEESSSKLALSFVRMPSRPRSRIGPGREQICYGLTKWQAFCVNYLMYYSRTQVTAVRVVEKLFKFRVQSLGPSRACVPQN